MRAHRTTRYGRRNERYEYHIIAYPGPFRGAVSCRVESLLAVGYSLHLISRQTQVALVHISSPVYSRILSLYTSLALHGYVQTTVRSAPAPAPAQHQPTPQPSSAILPPFLEADAMFSHPAADSVVRGWRQAPSYLLALSLPQATPPRLTV